MDDLIKHINSLDNKIHNSSGCNYLYSDFDELVNELEVKKDKLTTEGVMSLILLFRDLALEARYNHCSVNWIRYSARSFYCADYLIRYLPKDWKSRTESFLNYLFNELIKGEVAAIIPKEVFNKYLDKNLTDENYANYYDTILTNTILASIRGRTWSDNEMSLALSHTETASRLIKEYIRKFNDYSYLKKWIPLLNTRNLVYVWCEYLDCRNPRYDNLFIEDSVEEILEKMLDIHLELLNHWFRHNPEEMINTFSQEELIEILEVYDDKEFESTLEHMLTIPSNNKIKGIFEHFIEDEEDWIVRLSQRLLDAYTLNEAIVLD